MNKFRYYLIRTGWKQFLIVSILIIIAVLYKMFDFSIKEEYDKLFASTLSITTMILAIFIWYNDKNKDWKNSLPKLLSVAFVYENNIIMVCKNAGLAHQNDIRNWAQQIGKQMCNGEWLDFNLAIEQSSDSIPSLIEGTKYMSNYTVVTLVKLPKKISDHYDNKSNPNPDNKTMVWKYNFETKDFDEYWIKLQPEKPDVSKFRLIEV